MKVISIFWENYICWSYRYKCLLWCIDTCGEYFEEFFEILSACERRRKNPRPECLLGKLLHDFGCFPCTPNVFLSALACTQVEIIRRLRDHQGVAPGQKVGNGWGRVLVQALMWALARATRPFDLLSSSRLKAELTVLSCGTNSKWTTPHTSK